MTQPAVHSPCFYISDMAFPLIDCVRILALNKEVVKCVVSNNKTVDLRQADLSNNSYLTILYRHVEPSTASLNTKLVFYRLFSNFFKQLGQLGSRSDELSAKTLELLLAESTFILRSILTSVVDSQWDKLKANKGLQASLTTVLLNYSILVYNFESNEAQPLAQYKAKVQQVKEALFELLNDPTLADKLAQFDSEAIFRVLVTIGNLLTTPASRAAISLAGKYDTIRTLVNTVRTQSDAHLEKVNKCNSYLFNILN